MNVVKITAVTSCCVILVVLLLTILTKKENDTLYNETLEILKTRENLSSAQEVLECFPKLKIIKSKQKRIACLQRSIHSLTGGPAPNLSSKDQVQLRKYTREIEQLRVSIQHKLAELQAYGEKETALADYVSEK
ncbi:hypothetical protein M0D21_15405 [Aquimarina sp. D1M17]|uniref:hypothetical protein n=1 Tax=Aquimarina acroporae TaxID=2937283 RepID=UPI0020C0AFD4|nr:hypothetical protein [Aquimarina acroporae]MCK8522963.1 hypothetical protein [Aquimarina acroporae]